MNKFTKIIGLVIALATSSAHAIPTLLFDGTINYATNTQELSVSAVLTETFDITPAPELSGSSMMFSALLYDVESLSGGCFFCVASTQGNFIGNANPSIDDLIILDGFGDELLTAKFTSLSLEGANGGDNGVVNGLLTATGGSLMSLFDGSDLFAFQLNLNTLFSSAMYQSDFSGRVDGNIKGSVSVPEPSLLALLGLGILIVSFTRKTNVLKNNKY